MSGAIEEVVAAPIPPSGSAVEKTTTPFVTKRWKLRDQASIQDFSSATAGVGDDDTAVFQEAAASGVSRILVPDTTAGYSLTDSVAPTSGQRWIGQGATLIEQHTWGKGVFVFDTVDHASAKGFHFICQQPRVHYTSDPTYGQGLGAAVFVVNSSRVDVDVEVTGFYAGTYFWGPHADDGEHWDQFNRLSLVCNDVDMGLLYQAQEGLVVSRLQCEGIDYTFQDPSNDKPPHAIYGTGRNGLDGINAPRYSKNCYFGGIVALNNPHSAGIQFKYTLGLEIHAVVDGAVRAINLQGCEDVKAEVVGRNFAVKAEGSDTSQTAVNINGCKRVSIEGNFDLGAIDNMRGFYVRGEDNVSEDIVIRGKVRTEAADPGGGYVIHGTARCVLDGVAFHSETGAGIAIRTAESVDANDGTTIRPTDRLVIKNPIVTGTQHIIQIGDPGDTGSQITTNTRIEISQDNLFDGIDGGAGIADYGTGTVLEVKGASLPTLSGGATPSQPYATLLTRGLTPTTGTRTYTDLRNGIVGQEVTIISAAAGTTINDGGNFVLARGAAWNSDDRGGSITLRKGADGKWYEVSRSKLYLSDLGEFFDVRRGSDCSTLPRVFQRISTGVSPSTGSVRGWLAKSRSAQTYSTIKFQTGTTAPTGLTDLRFAVWKADGTLLADTGDVHATVTASGTTYTLTLTTPVSLTSGQEVYIGYAVAGTSFALTGLTNNGQDTSAFGSNNPGAKTGGSGYTGGAVPSLTTDPGSAVLPYIALVV